jgi:hypothetical protein
MDYRAFNRQVVANVVCDDVSNETDALESVSSVKPTRNDELMAKAIANAVENAERKKGYRRQSWKRDDMEQGELL